MKSLTESTQSDAAPQLGRVLIVDDNASIARSLARVLEQASYQTTTVYRGSEAIEFARENKCIAALVDIHLPDMNGLVVSQKIRELLGPDVPIIVVSGDTSMEVINSLSHVGATYFFSKPVNVAYLLDRLKEWTMH